MAAKNDTELMEKIADRLISERVRLDYSKADFARNIDITQNTLRTYEMAQSNIPSNILVKMALIGVDLTYVLLNQRNIEQAEEFAEKERKKGKQRANYLISGTLHNSIVATNGSTINHNVNTDTYITRTTAEVKPSSEHITNEQAAYIQKLVDDIVTIEQKIKKTPRSHKAIWTTLNRRMNAPTYRLIKLDQFEDTKKYLLSIIGTLTNMPSARKKLPDNEWRNRRYRYIHASFKELPELESWFTNHIKQKFGKTSKSELSDDELNKAYTSLTSKKRSLMKEKR